MQCIFQPKKCALDLIVAFEVVEHLENPDLALRESYRCLKSGGILILTMPTPKSPSDQKTGCIKLYCYKDITLVPQSIFTHKAMIVPAMSLSDLIGALKRRGFNRILVKMDCEGCEHEALHEVA